MTRLRQLQQRLADSQVEVQRAYQELQWTNEELEMTKEALHSTVEQLETTNEELQNTNEALETLNEEFQSTNEELQAIHDELAQRSDSLNEANRFLDSVLTSLRSGVVVLDDDLRVSAWNLQAEELWGVRAEDVAQASFLSLDIGLPITTLAEPLRACLAGTLEFHESQLAAVNRRGRRVVCKTSLYPFLARGSSLPRGVIVLMDEQREAASMGGESPVAPQTGAAGIGAGES